MTVNGRWLGALHAAPQAAVLALLAWVALVASVGFAHADDRCGIPAEVNALIDTVSLVSSHDEYLSPHDLDLLRRELDQAKQILADDRSGDLGLGGWKASFDWLFAASNSALKTGRFAAPDQVRGQVGALIVALRFSCSPSAASGRQLADQSDQVGGFRRMARRILGKKADHLFDLGYSPDLLLVVLGMVLSATALIWASSRIASWIARRITPKLLSKQRQTASAPESPAVPSQVYNQYDCRIPAALEVGLDVVDGSITALDGIGARFLPVNDGAFERIKAIEDLQEGDLQEVTLVVGSNQLAFLVLSVSHGVVSGIFKPPLSAPLMETLLKASEVPTTFTPPPKLASLAD